MTQTRLQKLYEKRAALDARIRRTEAREQRQERRIDTKRKILLGALVLYRMEREPGLRDSILKQLDGFLTRDYERALFGLAPLPPADPKTGAGPDKPPQGAQPGNQPPASS